MNWYVLYVKPQSEKKVASALEKIGVKVFCPTLEEVRVWSDRKKKIQVPLFKSYVFVCLLNTERQQVFAVPGVVRYLFWLGKPAVVRDEEIAAIQDWLSDEAVADVQVRTYTPGTEVKIAAGHFKGQKGVVQEVGRKRLKMVIKSLGVIVEARLKDLVK
ncbi:UpxY family transcription antiterminator [Leeuwenhoekiella sp. CH_XMU1409-2]|uniref:UpxY family transcription antiterminator n=1 Tax=Leeuwenhoekiella sp. CH_XMU1409-2 TaxID=3107768 RepID=UPI00300B038B